MNASDSLSQSLPASAAGHVVRTPGQLLLLGCLWLLATLIATFFATLLVDSTIVGELYVPRTNDSFYHARRILDAAVGERGFYQFDERLHPPEGTWIPWPWGYDWFMAQLTRLALWVRPELNPMAFLSYVPVAWIGLNAALFLGATGAAGLSLPLRALAMLAFALSPLTQLLHGVAMIDHHYVEFSFVLAVSWLGMRWLEQAANERRAIALGVVLGLAPAFHNGLFILQLLPLITILLLWLRGDAPPRRALIAFSLSLVVVTQLILLPSEPYRNGMFEFGMLSWFHFYISCSTAAVLIFIGWRPHSRRQLAGLGAVMLLLAIPLAGNLLQGTAFMAGQTSILGEIGEAQSPFRFDGETVASSDGISYYSWLLLLTPLVLLYFAIRLTSETVAARLYFAVAAVIGLAMLSLQFRFHYFGSFALITGILLIIDEQRLKREWHTGIVFVATLAALTLAYQPPLRERLFTIYAAGADPDYQHSMAIHLKLGEVCAEDPGLVLANNDDGNSILFHSDCSVIANNFVLGPEDDAKFAEITRLMRSTPAEILAAEPEIRYLFVRAGDFGRMIDDVMMFDASSAVVNELILATELPAGFELLLGVDGRNAPDAPPQPHSRLYRLERAGDQLD